MRRPGALFEHDPAAIEPFGEDWTAWLAELGAGVTISASTYTVSTIAGDAAPLVKSAETILAGNLRTQATFAGGTVGYKYTVVNHVTTSTAVQDERSFYVLVVQR